MSRIPVEDIVTMVNDHITELDRRATAEATFEEIEIDSLVCVEMAVLIGHHHGVELEEYEVAQTGSFAALAALVSERLSVQAHVV